VLHGFKLWTTIFRRNGSEGEEGAITKAICTGKEGALLIISASNKRNSELLLMLETNKATLLSKEAKMLVMLDNRLLLLVHK
jgi:hypothetical protein